MADMRKQYESALVVALREALVDEPRVTVRRGHVDVRAASDGSVAGTLALDYVAQARGHVLLAWAKEPPGLRELREEQPPPYRSNLLTANAMSFRCSGAEHRRFAPASGSHVPVPVDEGGIVSTCAWVVERLTEVFVPLLLDLVDLRPGLVADVLARPTDYAYPELTVVAAMRQNGMRRADVDTERLLGRRVSRQRRFTEELLATLG